MTHKAKPSPWAQALKDAAVRVIREYERYSADRDAAHCLCGHTRSQHCGCGEHCLAAEDPADVGKGTYKHCLCSHFAPKPVEKD